MAFPTTRHSLIQRLAGHASESDWQMFVDDYWPALTRFATYRGKLTREDAEDTAAEVFRAIIERHLLKRWSEQPTARLRALVCTVTRNVISNRARVIGGRENLLRDNAGDILSRDDLLTFQNEVASHEDEDIFETIWIEQLLRNAVEGLMREYNRSGKGDYFRVLYGRVCERMTMKAIAESLDIALSAVDNYYRAARNRLASRLEEAVRTHVAHYAAPETAEAEFQAEWEAVAQHLSNHGGLEAAITAAYQTASREHPSAQRASTSQAHQRLTQTLQALSQHESDEAV